MSRRTFQKKLRVERLEAKTVLAGNVVAEVVGGSLIVTGDAEDNEIGIAAGNEPGEFAIAGVPGTTVNGNAGITIFSNVTKDVKVSLGAGNDELSVAREFPRNLIIDGGDGDDEFFIGIDGIALGLTHVSNNLTIVGGDGSDLVHVGDLTVEGNLLFDGGKGDDGFSLRMGQFTPSSIGGEVVVITGKGSDSAGVESATIGGNLVIDTGSEDDSVGVAEVEVGGSTVVVLGSGTNEAQLVAVDAGATLTVGGSGSNIIVLADVDTSLLVSVVTSSGDDIIFMQEVRSAAAVVSSGSGNDELQILDSAFALLTMSLGSGDDTLDLSGVTVDGLALIYGNAGIDTLLLGENFINLGWAFSFEDVQNV